MAKPRTPIGTFGAIEFRLTDSGRVEARTRFRDWDGRLRRVQATGPTRNAAERKLKAKLVERSLVQPQFTSLTPDSRYTALADYWLEDMELEARLTISTQQTYERNMRNLVLPPFGELSLREVGVARCDSFIKRLARKSYNRARQARVVLKLSLGLAVRHEILVRNPMDHVSRLYRPATTPDGVDTGGGQRRPGRDPLLGTRTVGIRPQARRATELAGGGDARHLGTNR